MDFLTFPPTMDCPPEFCFCGRRTVESHEFWFCSVECARQDSLRSLGDRDCHYRNVVRDAYLRAAAPEPQPRRMMSADHLRVIPSSRNGNTLGFPTLAQLTGKVLTKKATAGEPLVAERHDRPRWEGFPSASSRGHPAQGPGGRIFKQGSPDVIPPPEHVPARSLRRVRPFLNFGKSKKAKEGETPERAFGHAVNPIIIPPVRKESLPSQRQVNPPSAASVQATKALRRSASFAGWNAKSHGGPSNEQDPLMHIIEEMREELATERFDPKSLFDEEPY